MFWNYFGWVCSSAGYLSLTFIFGSLYEVFHSMEYLGELIFVSLLAILSIVKALQGVVKYIYEHRDSTKRPDTLVERK